MRKQDLRSGTRGRQAFHVGAHFHQGGPPSGLLRFGLPNWKNQQQKLLRNWLNQRPVIQALQVGLQPHLEESRGTGMAGVGHHDDRALRLRQGCILPRLRTIYGMLSREHAIHRRNPNAIRSTSLTAGAFGWRILSNACRRIASLTLGSFLMIPASGGVHPRKLLQALARVA